MEKHKGLLALTPVLLLFAIFVMFFVTGGITCRVPVIAVFITVSAYSLLICGGKTDERVRAFSEGASSHGIMYMLWIFILAGAFGEAAKQIGAVDATVAATLSLVSPEYLPAGIFLASCFISMAVGTSVGTIVVMCPVAAGFAEQLSQPVGWFVAIVVGGAFFGDNLSFISDTTVAATQTQGCSMRDKFKANFLLVLPAAILTVLIYILTGSGMSAPVETQSFDGVRIIPYVLVIALMLMGMDVLAMLACALAVTAAIGIIGGDYGITGFCSAVTDGVTGMSELIVVTMLAGGILGIVKKMNGLEYLMEKIRRRIHTAMQAEFAIAAMTFFADICTANNTIAILTAGDMVKGISSRYGISAKRAASIMDTVSCLAQGIIPYGAQLLIASQKTSVTAQEIVPYLYYPLLTGIMVIVSILTKPAFKKLQKNCWSAPFERK